MAKPPSKYPLTLILANIWREPLLRFILLLSIVIALGLPLFNSYFLVPKFSAQLQNNVEDEARRTAEYMMENTFPDGQVNFPPEQMAAVDQKINAARTAMLLDKVKVFSSDGSVLYSTEKQNIGQINNKSYFQTIVRQGNIYSKIVRKDMATGEGRITSKDVAEVYIPVMNGAEFTGAFEIYYDITEKEAELSSLIKMSFMLSLHLSGLLFTLLLLVIGRSSKVSLRRKAAEEALRESNNTLEERLREQTYEIEMTQKTSIEALAILAESYDAETGAHLERIQRYVECLADSLQKKSSHTDYLAHKSDYVAEITLASLLHDIGKTAVPKSILSKRGKLTEDEFAVVKTHTEIAGSIIGRANQSFAAHFGKDSYLAFARDIALHHHERWDGNGYPHQLKGEDIPLSARIVAIADVYDALRSRRPYKEPWSHEAAVEEIVKCRATHFDPELVDLFLADSARFAEISAQIMPGEKIDEYEFNFSTMIQAPPS